MPTCYKRDKRENAMQCICRDCTKPSGPTEKGELAIKNIVRPETGDSIRIKAPLIIVSEFEDASTQFATALIEAIRENAATYGDMERAILDLRRALIWDDRKIALGLLVEVESLLGKEKSRLPVANSFSD